MAELSTTVRVKRDGPRGWHNIPAAAYDPAKHELVEGEVAPTTETRPDDADPGTAGKGFEPDKGDQVEIPADWEALHWTKQVALALEITGGKGPLVTSEGQTQAEKAKAIIRSVLAEA